MRTPQSNCITTIDFRSRCRISKSMNQLTQGCSLPDGLAASGPNADYAGQLMLFGQFVGDWEVDFTVHRPDGEKQIEKAEWHFGWVLDGRAIQDVFVIPRRSDWQNSTWARPDYGTCLCFYDASIEGWRVVWISPRHAEVFTFTARLVADEIILEGKDKDNLPMRWIFSNITANSFQWRRVGSPHNGATWQLQKDMIVQRAGK